MKLFVEHESPELSSSPSPRLFSTHLPFSSLPENVKNNNNNNNIDNQSHACNNKTKIVYLCRNPKDVFVSLRHFTKSLTKDDEFDKFCRGVSVFGPYWDHVLGYWNRSREDPTRVLFLRYEEIKERPGDCLRAIAGFLGCPITDDEERSGLADEILRVCGIDNLRALEVNKTGKLSTGEETKLFFRRGIVGDWENHLTREMAERIDRITEDKFGGSGLVV